MADISSTQEQKDLDKPVGDLCPQVLVDVGRALDFAQTTMLATKLGFNQRELDAFHRKDPDNAACVMLRALAARGDDVTVRFLKKTLEMIGQTEAAKILLDGMEGKKLRWGGRGGLGCGVGV